MKCRLILSISENTNASEKEILKKPLKSALKVYTIGTIKNETFHDSQISLWVTFYYSVCIGVAQLIMELQSWYQGLKFKCWQRQCENFNLSNMGWFPVPDLQSAEPLSHHDLHLPPGRWTVWWRPCRRGISPFDTKLFATVLWRGDSIINVSTKYNRCFIKKYTRLT